MQEIIAPIHVSLLKAELTEERRLRMTNKSNNEIYIVTAQDSPNTMLEIGRLREIAFREAGGGTGKEADIDEFDTMTGGYKQLIVWNPETEEIIGGYRYMLGDQVQFDSKGQPILATAHMFNFSERFIKDYLPYTIELARSFVRVEYQSSRAGFKGLYALDNLWDGLAAVVIVQPKARYLFGKMTMYPSYDRVARDMILYFLQKHFNDPENLIQARHPLKYETDVSGLKDLFVEDDLRADYRILNKAVRDRGLNIPPLINAYMNLSPTMRMFGTAINDEFGAVEETGIFIDTDQIFEEKRKRHFETFVRENPDSLSLTSGAMPVFSPVK